MTPQEIIDKVGNHLLDQGKRSTAVYSCAYRGDGGTMCAAGCLIPDEVYDPAMEGRRWTTLALNFKHIQALTDDIGHDLIKDLQRMHDSVFPVQWEDYLQQLVKVFNEDHPKSKIHFTRQKA